MNSGHAISPSASAVPGPTVGLPKRLHDHVVDELGLRMMRGIYAIGATLPIEDELASEFGVSRTVVREAIKVLAKKNLIEVKTRSGTRVLAKAAWNALDPDILRWRFSGDFDQKLVSDLIDLRRIIEPAAAELAAQRATPEQVLELQEAWRTMCSETALEAHIKADLEFHLCILRASNNDLLQGLRQSIEGALRFAIRFSTHSKDDGRSSLPLHEDVLAAIVDCDAQAARRAMEAIINRWADDSQRILQRSGRRPESPTLSL